MVVVGRLRYERKLRREKIFYREAFRAGIVLRNIFFTHKESIRVINLTTIIILFLTVVVTLILPVLLT